MLGNVGFNRGSKQPAVGPAIPTPSGTADRASPLNGFILGHPLTVAVRIPALRVIFFRPQVAFITAVVALQFAQVGDEPGQHLCRRRVIGLASLEKFSGQLQASLGHHASVLPKCLEMI
jgi:hypothetical protein